MTFNLAGLLIGLSVLFLWIAIAMAVGAPAWMITGGCWLLGTTLGVLGITPLRGTGVWWKRR